MDVIASLNFAVALYLNFERTTDESLKAEIFLPLEVDDDADDLSES